MLMNDDLVLKAENKELERLVMAKDQHHREINALAEVLA